MWASPGLGRATALLAAALAVVVLAGCSDDGAEDDASGPEASAPPPSSTTTIAAGAVVPTEQGPVVGTVADGVRTFLGIPYAAAPVGERRFAPPEPPPDRTERLDATERPPACVQETTSASAEVSEDCLFLNVVTPDPPQPDLPVVVWLHGGSFLTGQGDDQDARRLVADHDLVVVTVNHRLGVLGFLAHPELSEQAEDGTSGNLGLDDQREALRWVQDNVAAFGGDPEQVTLAGHSAGAASACFHTVSPESDGLFQGVIEQSGVCGGSRPVPTLEQGERSGEAVAEALGCEPGAVPACLRATSVFELAGAVQDADLAAAVAASPLVDGTSVPDQPPAMIRRGEVADVPVIVGSTSDEATVFVYGAYDRTGESLPDDEYADALALFFGADRVDELLAAYPVAAYRSASQALAAARTDWLVCGIDDVATAYAAQVPTYRYEFADPTAPFSFPPTPGLVIGAGHGAELAYLFHSLSYPLVARSPAQLTAAQEQVSDELTAAWTSFAADGDPNGPGAPRWPEADPDDDERLVFTADGAALRGGFREQHRCDLWPGS